MQEDYLEDSVYTAKVGRRASDTFVTPGKAQDLISRADTPERMIDPENPALIFSGQYLVSPIRESPLERSPRKRVGGEDAFLPIYRGYLAPLLEFQTRSVGSEGDEELNFK